MDFWTLPPRCSSSVSDWGTASTAGNKFRADYADAVERAFGCHVDYGQVVKTYTRPDPHRPPPRASSGLLIQIAKRSIFGTPNRNFISTSIVERLNASTRQHLKRVARATLAFSKKRENYEASVDLHFTFYNLCRITAHCG